MARDENAPGRVPELLVVKSQMVTGFSEHEEGFCQLLTMLGIRRNVARSLVFLASVQETTSRDVERGTDLRQPEVSLAMQHLVKRAWVSVRLYRPENRGRPGKVYSLALPLETILSVIEEEKRHEAIRTIQLTEKMYDFVGDTTYPS